MKGPRGTRQSPNSYLGIAALLSATFPLWAQNPSPAALQSLDQKHPELVLSQEEYAESRAELLKTSIASHLSVLFGAGTESTRPVPSDKDLKALRDTLDEARSAMIRAHRQYRSTLEKWTRERLKDDFPSSIDVAPNTDAFASAEPPGNIKLSVGFLRAQVHAAVAQAVGDEYAQFTDSIMTMVRNEHFTDYHTLHDLKWPDNSSGADFTSAWTRMWDGAYRAGLWFVVAHEMGHLAMGHLDRDLNCNDSRDAERAADRYATAMLSFTLTEMEKTAAAALLGEGADFDTTGAAGYEYFFLVGYSEAFTSRGGEGCQLHPPAAERAALLREIAALTFQSPVTPEALASLKATHEDWAPGVTAAVSAKCSIGESETTQKIKGTVDALLALYTGATIQIGIEPSKEIVKRIWEALDSGETPDCVGPFLFEFEFRKNGTPNQAGAFRRCTESLDKGKYDQAIDDCSQAISLDPTYAPAFVSRGNAYQEKQQYDRAIQDYNQATSLDPGYAIAFVNRGMAYRNKGQDDRAIQDHDHAIMLDPDLTPAFVERGLAYQHKQQYDRAIQDYDQAIGLDSKYVLAFQVRAVAYSNKEQYDRAIQDYDHAIRLDPKDFNSFFNRGVTNFNAGRFPSAAKDFAQGVALNERHTYGVLWLHLARGRSGQNDAEELKNNAARLDLTVWPGPALSFYLGLLMADKVTEAAKTGDDKTQRDRGCEAAFFLAEASLLRHRDSEAVPLLRQAREACPVNLIEYNSAATELKRLAR